MFNRSTAVKLLCVDDDTEWVENVFDNPEHKSNRSNKVIIISGQLKLFYRLLKLLFSHYFGKKRMSAQILDRTIQNLKNCEALIKMVTHATYFITLPRNLWIIVVFELILPLLACYRTRIMLPSVILPLEKFTTDIIHI